MVTLPMPKSFKVIQTSFDEKEMEIIYDISSTQKTDFHQAIKLLIRIGYEVIKKTK